MSGLHFIFTADNKNFMNALNQIAAGVSDAKRKIEADGQTIESFFNRVRNLSAISFAGIGLGSIVNQIKDTRAYFQDIESTMKVFLGDAEKANEFTAKLKDYAYYNMFEFSDLAQASQQLIAYGNDVETVIPTIHKLSEIAVATHADLGEMIGLYNKAKSTGVVGSEMVESFATRGLVIKDVMKEMGTYVQGQTITFKQLNEVLDKVTSEGGLFHGIQDAQMENISANIGQLEDNLSLMFDEIGRHLQEPIYEVLQFGSDVIDHWKEVGAVIAATIASAGLQKGVELVTTTVDRTAIQATYAAEITQLNELLGKKSEEEKTSLQQAVASGHLTQAKADEIEKLREEADAHLKVLEAKEAEAAAEMKLANADVSDLTDWKNELDEKIEQYEGLLEAYNENADAIIELYGQEAIEEAQQELSTMARERDSVATELNTATERQNTAARNLNAATTQREAASTAIDTAAITQNTFWKKLQIAATTMLTKAQLKLNAAIEANKISIFLAAVAALSYTIYKLATYESDAEKAIKSANDAVEKQENSMRKEISTLDELKKKLESSKKGTDEWKSAKESIVSQFGKYHQGLDYEITKTGTLAASYDKLTQSIRLSAAARAMEQFRNDNDPQEDIDKALEATRKRIESTRFDLVDDKGNTKVEDGKYVKGKIKGALAEQVQQAMYEYINGKEMSKFAPKIQSYLRQIGGWDAEIFKARQKTSAISRGEEVIAKRYGTTVEAIDGVDKDDKIEYDDPRTEKDKIKQELDAKIKQYDQLKKGTAEALEIKKEIESLEKQLAEFNDYKGEKKKSSSSTAEQLASKTAAEEQQLIALLKRQAEERLKAQQSYEYELWQNRIDLMDEGEAKVLAQMRLDQDKERIALKERQQQEVEAEIARQKAVFDAREDVNASKNKKYARHIFNTDIEDKDNKDIDFSQIEKIRERYASLESDLAARQAKAEADRLDAARQSMNAYLQEFGNYQQKRLAIAEDYETRISEAQNEGERMMLTAQRDKALSDLDYDEWIDTGSIALAFGDITKLSNSTIDRLIADMEKYREKVIATFDPQKISEYEAALSNLRKVRSDESFGIFSSVVPEYFKERKSVAGQKDSAADNVNALYEQRAAIYNRILDLQKRINEATAKGEDTTAMENELRDSQAALNTNADAAKKAQDAFKLLQEQWDRLNSPEDKFYAVCEAVAAAAGLVGDLTSGLSDMLDAMGADGLGKAVGTFGEAMGSVQNIASGFAKGGMIGGIAAAAGEVMNWATKIFMAGDARHEKNIQRIQKQIDALSKSYDNLGEKADKAFSTDASGLIDQQNKLLEQQKVLIKQQMAEEEAKKKTDSEKIKAYREQLEEIDKVLADNKEKAKEAIIGEDLKSAINEFASLYAGAWDDGTDAASKSMAAVKNIVSSTLTELLKKKIQPAADKFYDTLAEAMKDGILSDAELEALDAIKAQMDALAATGEEQYKKIRDRYKDLDELREELTDISFDSVRDNFKSKLLDMSSDAADFRDDLTEIIRGSLVEGLMDTKYDAMLKEWYEDFAEAMRDQSLTDGERDMLRQQYEDIINQGIADRDAVNSIIGGGAYSQSASTGSAWNMNQETGDELKGRFTALTELQVVNNGLMQTQNSLTSQILASLHSMNNISSPDMTDPTLLAIKDMMFLSTGFLEDIRKHTKVLYLLDERLTNLNSLIDRKL